MSRVKGGMNALKRRRNVLKAVKGYRFGRSKKERQAREAIFHAGKYAFAHRKDKKNDMRHLWTIRISAGLATTTLGASGKAMSYSKFMGALKKAEIAINRKMLSELAAMHPNTFKIILEKVS